MLKDPSPALTEQRLEWFTIASIISVFVVKFMIFAFFPFSGIKTLCPLDVKSITPNCFT